MKQQSFNAPSYVSDIPIVQKLFDFYKVFHGLVLKFPKADKHTLGQDTSSHILALLEMLVSASKLPGGTQKSNLLFQASSKLELLKLLIRLCFEIKAISNKQYLALESNLQEIGKMLGGWIKSVTR